MFDLRKKIFVGIGLVIIIVLIFLGYWFFTNKQKDLTNQNNLTNSNGLNNQDPGLADVIKQNSSNNFNNTETITVPQNPDEIYLKQLAKIFVERFGTYSNQNDNQHIIDVSSLVTDKMAQWLETKKLNNSPEYEGVITRVIATNLEEKDEISATVIIQAQQTIESLNKNEVVQKNGKVVFSKVDAEWKVDGFYWD